MSERFHVNSDLSIGLVVVHGPEAHHLAAVRRIRPGDPVCLFNGDGREYPGRVVEVSRKDVTIEVTAVETPARELPHVLHIAAPLPKGDRAQFLIEKLTELGVTRLTLLSTARSVVTPREAKLEKLDRYVIEASKQCGRNVLMPIDPPREWRELVSDETLPARRVVAHPAGKPMSDVGGDVIIAVGPEGGFTEEEINLALQSGWQLVGLGPRILRVETAAVALAAMWGER